MTARRGEATDASSGRPTTRPCLIVAFDRLRSTHTGRSDTTLSLLIWSLLLVAQFSVWHGGVRAQFSFTPSCSGRHCSEEPISVADATACLPLARGVSGSTRRSPSSLPQSNGRPHPSVQA